MKPMASMLILKYVRSRLEAFESLASEPPKFAARRQSATDGTDQRRSTRERDGDTSVDVHPARRRRE